MHIPVLQKEVLEYLDPKQNENFIDCTIGGGGHALAIIEKILPNGRLLGIDADEEMIRRLKIKNRKNNLILVCDNFVNLKKIVEEYNFKKISGILFDLGLSSWHLEESGRGFSFLKDEPLDMRFSITHFSRSRKSHYSSTAEKVLNTWPEKEIARILKEYGQERFAKMIVKGIVKAREIRPIETTFQLVEIIKKAVPKNYERGRIHPATRTFQSLRIAVNDELNNLKNVLPQTLEILEKNGRLVIISFHSLEDRIVKDFFKNQAKNNLLEILTKKPIIPSAEEIKINPRSRSAKLRAAITLRITN